MRQNRILDSDSYKTSHFLAYPPQTTKIFSYLESRGCERDWQETVFFGLQYLLKRYFLPPIEKSELEEAAEVVTAHGCPFNYNGWLRLIEKHGGRLPIRIRAVPEGLTVNLKNVLLTVENTDPEFFWLTTYLETTLMRLWYPITVCTQSFQLRKLILRYLRETSDSPDSEIDYKLHDFGSRGVSSQESASIGAASHLVNFKGTDTMTALPLLRDYYDEPMAAFSIPAAEHSTVTSWGRENETEAYRAMLRAYGKPGKVLAVVSDSWDIYHAVEHIWGETLRQEVVESGATLVIRPDSGDPATVINEVMQLLEAKFGSVENSKGFRVLNNVRVLQGDGVNENSIKDILVNLKSNGFSVTNIAFGMGGALLQKVDRDTLKFAYKCSSATVAGQERDVYKDPVTDSGKSSKKGRLDLIRDFGWHDRQSNLTRTVRLAENQVAHPHSLLRTVFENGELLVETSFAEIRAQTIAGY